MTLARLNYSAGLFETGGSIDMVKKAFLILAAGLIFSGPVWAFDDKFSKNFQRCLDQAVGDFDIIECAQREFEKQDARLNVVYKKLMAKESEEQKKKLREAQRAWIKFRDAWGDYLYDQQGGTLARVTAMMWHLEATADQAGRLEQRLQFLAE